MRALFPGLSFFIAAEQFAQLQTNVNLGRNVTTLAACKLFEICAAKLLIGFFTAIGTLRTTESDIHCHVCEDDRGRVEVAEICRI
jgi:hypothetical protein